MKVLIVGATSAIAQETARCFAAGDGASFLLAGRSAPRLEAVAADLRARGALAVDVWAGDLTSLTAPAEVLQAAGELDVALIAHGSLSDEVRAAADPAYRASEIAVNLTSPAAFAYAAAEHFRAKKAGQIALITSVAGIRGRAKLLWYGSAKAGLIAFSQGLRASLCRDGVAVTELRPGLITTPMSAAIKQGLLSTSAAQAGRLSYHAIKARREIAYIPGYWVIIMTIIRLIPEKIFQRMTF